MKCSVRVLVALVAASISMSLLGPVVVSAAGVPSSTASLRAQAVTIHQMPVGWVAEAPRGDPRLGCLAALMTPKGVKETHQEQVFFAAPKGYPIFDETITTYSKAKVTYKKVATAIAKCRTFKGVLTGYPVVGTLRPLVVPRYGSARVAYVVTLVGKRITVKTDYLIVRKGSDILGILEGSYPAVSVTQFLHFAALAVARVK